MNREDFVTAALKRLGVPLSTPKGLDVLKMVVEGYRKAGWNGEGQNKFTKKWFSNKKPGIRILTYLLELENKAWCYSCGEVKSKDSFHGNISTENKRQGYCKACNMKVTYYSYPDYYKNEAAKRRSKLEDLKQLLSEKDQEKLANIYKNCPKGYHVDHIIPLSKGGPHAPWNLQYLPEKENLQKRNKITIKELSLYRKNLRRRLVKRGILPA